MSVLDTDFQWGEVAAYKPMPWHQAAFTSLAAQFEADRLSHAYLVSGAEGAGVMQFMYAFAAGLLCKQPQGLLACGACRSCELTQAGGHPDAKLLVPEDAKVIKIDQVRAAISFGAATAQQGGYRVIMIAPGEALNINGANALLKLLEEPGQKTCLIIASYSPATLMPTLRSRCQKLVLPSPTASESSAWLGASGFDAAELSPRLTQRPFEALALLRAGESDPYLTIYGALKRLVDNQSHAVEFSKACMAYDGVRLADLLYASCLDLVKGTAAGAQRPLLAGLAALTEWRRQLINGATINNELYLQSWAIQLIKANKA